MELSRIFGNYPKKKTLVTLAKEGDKEAFTTLIEENMKSVYRVAKGMLNNEHDIEDVIQNSIIKAYENISKLKNDEFFKTWFIRIVINESNSIIRQNKKIIVLDEVKVSKVYEEKTLDFDLMEAIDQLKYEFRVVTILYYIEDMSQKEIARVLQIAEGTVRSRLSRAREKLYEIMKEEELKNGKRV